MKNELDHILLNNALLMATVDNLKDVVLDLINCVSQTDVEAIEYKISLARNELNGKIASIEALEGVLPRSILLRKRFEIETSYKRLIDDLEKVLDEC